MGHLPPLLPAQPCTVGIFLKELDYKTKFNGSERFTSSYVLVIYCHARIIPKLSVLKQQQQQTKTTTLFSHRSVAQGCKCGLAGSSPKVSVIQWLNWEGPTTEWLLAGLSSFFFDIFIDYAITLVPFLPLHSTPSCPPPLSHIPPL